MSFVTFKVHGQECSLSPLLFYVVLDVLASSTRKEKEITGIQTAQIDRNKLLICRCDAMIVYVGNAKESSKKPTRVCWGAGTRAIHKIQLFSHVPKMKSWNLKFLEKNQL